MQEMLRRIVHEVSNQTSLQVSLQVMVVRVREALQTQASTIFLLDNCSAEFVVMATAGLNPDAVGRLRIGREQGLIGLVARREELLNLDNAPAHPNFLALPEIGEEAFKACLAVPIIHQKRVYGVLTVQQEAARLYDKDEEALLMTIAALLGGVIATADAKGTLAQLPGFSTRKTATSGEADFSGLPCVPGVGIGTAVVVYPPADLDAVPERYIQADEVDAESEFFIAALASTRAEIQRLSDRLSESLPPEEHALFDAYLGMLHKKGLGQEVLQLIKDRHLTAQAALKNVIKKYVNHFEALEDTYLRERAADFRDLGRRVLAQLQSNQPEIQDYPEATILIGDELSAADLADVPEGYLKGVISTKGARNSHLAILARALAVPAVMSAKGVTPSDIDSQPVIVDGYFGQVFVRPTPELLQEYQRLQQKEIELNASLDDLRDEPAQTEDGYKVKLYVNTGLAADASLSMSVGAEGIGLYRSEVPFLSRDRFPSQEEQRIIYHQLLKAFAPRPVIMRTLDAGGDKNLPYFPVYEENPFLGWRGIRMTLDHPDLFLTQIRAMLLASEGLDNLQIMLPMITGVSEVDEALDLISQAYKELLDEGARIIWPQIGVMIEVPAAVYQARRLAARVDFLSVGTNDLTQYMLAVDRNNPRVASMFDSLHPAMLRALLQVVEGAHAEGKQVGICGEMAADPLAIPILLAMNFDSLSMNSTSLPRVKWVIRNFSLHKARKILSEVLEMEDPALIRFHLEKQLDIAGLGSLIRAGKR